MRPQQKRLRNINKSIGVKSKLGYIQKLCEQEEEGDNISYLIYNTETDSLVNKIYSDKISKKKIEEESDEPC